jgi:hypothetical protein
MGQRQKSAAASLVDCSKWRVRPEDYQARIAERDARLAADTRTDVQRILGDPPPSRSALARGRVVNAGTTSKSASGMRVDLWRK